MSNAPVCHVSTGSQVIQQPRPTLLPSVPVAVDLPSALAAIAALKLLIQQISGQQSVAGPRGLPGLPGLRGFDGLGGGGFSTAPGDKGQKGDNASKPSRWSEDKSQRVTQKKRIFQDNDKTSDNWVDISQINRVVWVDSVNGERIVWTR